MSFDERCAEYLGMIEPALAGYFGRKEGLPFDGPLLLYYLFLFTNYLF